MFVSTSFFPPGLLKEQEERHNIFSKGSLLPTALFPHRNINKKTEIREQETLYCDPWLRGIDSHRLKRLLETSSGGRLCWSPAHCGSPLQTGQDSTPFWWCVLKSRISTSCGTSFPLYYLQINYLKLFILFLLFKNHYTFGNLSDSPVSIGCGKWQRVNVYSIPKIMVFSFWLYLTPILQRPPSPPPQNPTFSSCWLTSKWGQKPQISAAVLKAY